MVGMAECILLFDFESPAHQVAMHPKDATQWPKGRLAKPKIQKHAQTRASHICGMF